MESPLISRDISLLEKLVIVDGQPGCGKTMLSPIISSFQRVELLTYCFELEHIARLYKLKKITKDATIALIKIFTDNKLYQLMMGREVNFRYSDISSVYNYPFPNVYVKRLFDKGDEEIPNKILKHKPILHLVTHDMLSSAEILFESLKNKLIFIEVVRHPLYQLIQQSLNFENVFNKPRDISVYFKKKGKEFPYFVHGWEKDFLNYNSVEKAIKTISIHTKENHKVRKRISDKYKKNLITVPFEKFVKNPYPYLNTIVNIMETNNSKKTSQILKKQKIPRKKIADSLKLDIYKRCGWKPPVRNLSEKDELNLRRNYAIKNNVSQKLMNLLDCLSSEYEKKNF
jgi:hypothetical protein